MQFGSSAKLAMRLNDSVISENHEERTIDLAVNSKEQEGSKTQEPSLASNSGGFNSRGQD